MYELLYAGFDTLDVAIAGALPKDALDTLEKAREAASESQEKVLTTIGPGKVDMHVYGHGMKGGYAYVVDTGPVSAIWKLKKNTDPNQWNIFVSPRATMLLAYGYEGTRDQLLETLAAMGARLTDHSINRADFAMDFRTYGFELHDDQFVAHSHTKVRPYWGKRENTDTDNNQPSAVLRGRRLESMTIGIQPGRQIIVYDKKREAIEKQKPYWFKTWRVNRDDPELEVWRVEVRAGKRELKDKYQIRRFEDFDAGIGDVIVQALQDVRYLADRQGDSNVTRQELHALWIGAQDIASSNLTDLRSGLTPGQIVEIERELAIERYANLCLGNAIGWSVAQGLSDCEIATDLPDLVANHLSTSLRFKNGHVESSIKRARARLKLLN